MDYDLPTSSADRVAEPRAKYEAADAAEREFLAWEDASRDTVDVKRCYIRLAGDLAAGVLLSQLVFYFLPVKQRGRNGAVVAELRHWELTELRERKDSAENGWWLPRGRDGWEEEFCIGPYQFDRIVDELQKKGLVEKCVAKHNGNPTVHLRPCLGTLRRTLLGFSQEPNEVEPKNPCARDPYPVPPKRVPGKEGVARPPAHESPSDSEAAAAALYLDERGENAVFKWYSGRLTGRTWEEWKEQVGAHFAHGRVVTVEHLEAASARALSDFEAKGGVGPRRMGWFYEALKAVLNGAGPNGNGKPKHETADEMAARCVREVQAMHAKPGGKP